jgi:predicted N-acyltransferase
MFSVKVFDSIEDIYQKSWDECAGSNPFGKHNFFKALERSGALHQNGLVVMKYIVLISDSQEIVACSPGMLKWGTKREFGPEKLWLLSALADGGFKWPKFQIGIPFFPVLNNKLMVKKNFNVEQIQYAFIGDLLELTQKSKVSSVFNIMHVDESISQKCEALGGMISKEIHSIWINKNYKDSDHYWSKMPSRKKYIYNKERRRALSAGLEYRVISGRCLTDEILQDYYVGHQLVCQRYGNKPWLTFKTYQTIVENLRDDVFMLAYMDGKKFIAGSVEINDKDLKINYALQWSELYKLDCVALDLICYRSIENAINNKIIKVDSGVSALHKRLRGWDDVSVFNAHWFMSNEIEIKASQILNELKSK